MDTNKPNLGKSVPRRSPEHELKRQFGNEASKTKRRISEIDAEIVKNESTITTMEDMFSNPDEFKTTKQLTQSSEKYDSLKKQTDILWEEWTTLSLRIDYISKELERLDI